MDDELQSLLPLFGPVIPTTRTRGKQDSVKVIDATKPKGPGSIYRDKRSRRGGTLSDLANALGMNSGKANFHSGLSDGYAYVGRGKYVHPDDLETFKETRNPDLAFSFGDVRSNKADVNRNLRNVPAPMFEASEGLAQTLRNPGNVNMVTDPNKGSNLSNPNPTTQTNPGSAPPASQASTRQGQIGEVNTPPIADVRDQEDLQRVLGMSQDVLGRDVSGMTAKGLPEPEKVKGLKKAFGNLENILSNPAVLNFMSDMGIAFSGGHPNAPGTILGQANKSKLRADADSKLLEGLLQGKSVDEIDLGGMAANPEILSQGYQLTQKDRSLDQTDTQLEQSADRQEFNEWVQTNNVGAMWERLNLQQQGLDIDRLKANADALSLGEGMDSWHYGAGADAVASMWRDVALNNWQESLGEEFQSLTEMQKAFRDELGKFDPQAVMAELSTEQQAKARRQMSEVGRMVAQNADPAAIEEYINNMDIGASQSYNSQAEVQAAVQSGEIGVGDTFDYGGQTVELFVDPQTGKANIRPVR